MSKYTSKFIIKYILLLLCKIILTFVIIMIFVYILESYNSKRLASNSSIFEYDVNLKIVSMNYESNLLDNKYKKSR